VRPVGWLIISAHLHMSQASINKADRREDFFTVYIYCCCKHLCLICEYIIILMYTTLEYVAYVNQILDVMAVFS
jgi:hypothetical protein